MASTSSPSGSIGGRGRCAAMYASKSVWKRVAWLPSPQMAHGPREQRRGWLRRQLRQPHLWGRRVSVASMAWLLCSLHRQTSDVSQRERF